MAESIFPEEQSNFETFRDCFSEPVLKALAKPVEKGSKKKRVSRRSKDGKNGATKSKVATTTNAMIAEEERATAEDLGEFIDVRPSSQLPHPLNAALT